MDLQSEDRSISPPLKDQVSWKAFSELYNPHESQSLHPLLFVLLKFPKGTLEKEQYSTTFECLGVYLSDTGKGPFNNVSTHNIGVIYHGKGVGNVIGYMVMTAPDGDKVFVEVKEDETPSPPNPSKGTGKYIGGTGKFAGIEWTCECSRYYVRPAKAGTVQEVAHIKFHWKLPETKK